MTQAQSNTPLDMPRVGVDMPLGDDVDWKKEWFKLAAQRNLDVSVLLATIQSETTFRCPEGWRLVPIDPTRVMAERGEDAAVKQYDDSDWEEAKDMAEALDSRPIWKAMLDAAPLPEAQK